MAVTTLESSGLKRIEQLRNVPPGIWDSLLDDADRLIAAVENTDLVGIVRESMKLKDALKYVRTL